MNEKTLRDEFAMAALTGLISHHGWKGDIEITTDDAGRLADSAMLEREENKKGDGKPVGTITNNQRKVLNHMIRHYNEHGRSPTLKQAVEYLGMNVNSIHYAKTVLRNRGYLLGDKERNLNLIPLYDSKKQKLNFI